MQALSSKFGLSKAVQGPFLEALQAKCSEASESSVDQVVLEKLVF